MRAEGISDRTPRQIWLVNLFFGPGMAPTGVLLDSLAAGLSNAGWSVRILSSTAEYRQERNAEPQQFMGECIRFRCPATHRGVRGKLWQWLVFWFKLAWYLFWHRPPAVAVVQTTPPFLHHLFAVRNWWAWRPTKIILWNQDTYPEMLVAARMLSQKSLLYQLLTRIAHWGARRVAHAVVLDGAMADRLRRQGIHQITIIPNWHEPPCQPGSEKLPDLLMQMTQKFRYRVAYTGNLGRGHDLTLLWEFLRKHPQQTDLCFVFVGEGDRTAEVRELIAREGWSSVVLIPYLPSEQFNALLKWADLGLVALEADCLGLMSPSKLHAWLGAGKPVIYLGPTGSNVSETIALYQCGFEVNSTSPDAFESAWRALMSTECPIERLQANSFRAWEERHSVKVGLEAWLKVLESI